MNILDKIGVNDRTSSLVVQNLRSLYELKTDRAAWLKECFGHFGVSPTFDSTKSGLFLLQYLCDAYYKGLIANPADMQQILDDALTKIEFRKKKDPWMFHQDAEVVHVVNEETQEASVISNQPKREYKKEGGKKSDIVYQMFLDNIVTGKMSNSDFVKLIIKEAGMTTAGARTYANNAKTRYVKETGQEVDATLYRQTNKSKG